MKRILQLTLFIAALILGSTASQVFAQADYYWTGASNNDNWNEPTNWLRGPVGGNATTFTIATAAPGTTDNIYFDAAYYDLVNNTPSIVNIPGDVFGANIDASKAVTSGAATSIFSFTGNGTLYIHGSLNLPTGIINNYTGTIHFSGTSAATISTGIAVYNLALSKSNIVTLQTPVTVLNDLTINSGTLADGGFQITGSASGSLSMASGTALNLAAAFPTLFTTARILIAASSEVIYSSTAAQTVSAEPTYGSLVITGNSTKILAGAVTLYGNLTISNGTLRAGNLTNTITLGGNWTTNGGSFEHSNNTVTFNGSTTSTINTGSPFYKLTTSKDVNLASVITVQNDLNITNGTLDDRGFQITGNVSGNLTLGSIAKLSLGSQTSATTFPSFLSNRIVLNTGSTVEYAAGINQTVRGLSVTAPATSSYSHLTLSNPTGTMVNKTLDASTIVRGTLLINANNNLVDNGFQINNALAAGSTLSMSNNSVLTLGTSAISTKFPEFTTNTLSTTSTVVYNSGASSVTQTIKGGTVSAPFNYGNVRLTNSNATGTATKQLSGSILIKGNIDIQTRNQLNTGANNIAIEGNWVSNGQFVSGGTVTFNSSNDASIDVLSFNNSFNNLTINKQASSTRVTLAKPLVVNATLTITQGVLVANGNNIAIGSNWQSSTVGTFVHGGNTVTFSGPAASTITTASAFNNLTLNKSANTALVTLGSAININKDLAINSNSTLDVSTNNHNISIQGNWIGNGTFVSRNGTNPPAAPTITNGVAVANTATVTFNGSVLQTIEASITTGSHEFHNIVFNNTGNGITLNSQVSIGKVITNNLPVNNGSATFINGIVNTMTNYPQDNRGEADLNVPVGSILIFNDNTVVNSSVRPSDASHVNGYVRKVGDNDFWFPIGNGTYYRPSGIQSAGNSVYLTYDSKYILRNSAGSGLPSVTSLKTNDSNGNLASVSKYEYWDIVQVINNSASNIMLSWRMPISGGFEDPNYINQNNLWMLTVAAWESKVATSGQWMNRKMQNLTVTDTNPASFSGQLSSNTATPGTLRYWTLGSIFNALPIDLMYLRATAVENSVQLDWATAQEINNDYFTIEKSADGKNFTQITTVNGKGNSKAVSKYSAVDYAPYSGVTYYRLKQTDFDGKFTYSKTVAVQLNSIANSLQAYSVGSKALQLNYKVGGEENGALTIHDSRGVQVWSKLVSGTAAEVKEEVNMQSAANGMYIISLQTASGTITKKVIMF